eukprot:TRINITY_DN8373_c0_g1_i1.p3 TRINITY_DN8373_c0_g1~~TRINITY_DN8373_c0_g1_i1.p3  ORF type:complete len:232 (+),score=30.90 TRINITY_DN8373_c0_g1_i1:88-783(+)
MTDDNPKEAEDQSLGKEQTDPSGAPADALQQPSEQEQPKPTEETQNTPPPRHPLENRWTLWFDNRSKGSKNRESWGATLNTVYSFGNVEEFWCLYNNIQTPGKLQAADLHLFKEGIRPAWEDPVNEDGGSWLLQVPPKEGKNLLDKWWLDILLALIGEQFAEAGEICGVSANVRGRNDRITLWTKNAANEAAQISIGNQLRQITSFPDNSTLGYTFHSDAKNNRSSNRYTV